MGRGKIEKFGIKAITDALDGSDVAAARDSLSQLVGVAVEVSGKVQKRVKRDGQCKLVIEPGASVPGFVVFADCRTDAAKVTARKIRKGSFVAVRGKFMTFGTSAVCLSDCRLMAPIIKTEQRRKQRKNNERIQEYTTLKRNSGALVAEAAFTTFITFTTLN
jgi:hypothetical protein